MVGSTGSRESNRDARTLVSINNATPIQLFASPSAAVNRIRANLSFAIPLSLRRGIEQCQPLASGE